MAGIDEYSITAASNAAINSIDVAENCLPSGINNAIRQLMADIRRFANDIGAKAVSSGADTVTLTTETVLTAYADGTILSFIAGGTNTGAATLNVDGVGAKAIRKGADVALAANDILAGQLCIVAYDASANSSAGAWMLANPSLLALTGVYQPLDSDLTAIAALTTTSFGRGLLTTASQLALNATIVPVGTIVPYAGTSEPTGWLFCYGQAVSRSTYSALFSAISTTYGSGDGSTTFNLPDLRGRVVAGQDDMGGSSANRLTGLTDGVNGDNLGAAGGLESTTLTTAQMPLHGHAARISVDSNDNSSTIGGLMLSEQNDSNFAAFTGTPSETAGEQIGGTGGGGAHNNVQPTLILNYLVFAGA